jgi:hypothetical protein
LARRRKNDPNRNFARKLAENVVQAYGDHVPGIHAAVAEQTDTYLGKVEDMGRTPFSVQQMGDHVGSLLGVNLVAWETPPLLGGR